ncbi:hypothetical protein J2Z44_003862 [Clostridium punense]|uniref:Uncharacterized protein n=1 Tax=Clostridium punense TaxID=1054297 RepID=A0ABS4K8A5_9CLOT|nr:MULTISPECIES: hypothetical protein [Clostridium]EQB89623.1 hypothetical protein M918_19720 [Clostridium sp. BL8]MBP2024012.1 hypothetical protein [Clostridium punense]
MQDNFEVSNSQAQQVLTDECIIAQKVYGKCRQQDCLGTVDSNTTPSPGMIQIESSRLGETQSITNAALIGGTIAPNNIIAFNATVSNVVLVPNTFELSDIKVLNITPNAFGQDGFYDVTIKYTFNYEINLLDSNGDPIAVTLGAGPGTITNISAFTTYTKLISLFGGEASSNTVVTTNTLYSSASQYNEGNLPYVFAQGIANPMAISIGTYVVNDITQYQADITIGLFTIIKLFRIVNMMVTSAGNCDIPVCEPIQPGDPCDYFNSLPFPFDDFDPPSGLL